MKKSELKNVLGVLNKLYPEAEFHAENWWDTFRGFPAEVVLEGIRIWRKGQYGFRAPNETDIRDIDWVCERNPDGIFWKALTAAKERIERRKA
jgi:hypothetical protein